jgi:Bacterial SH3 domain
MKTDHKKTKRLVFLAIFLFGGLALSAASVKLKVTAEFANIRQKPSIGSPIVRQIPQGAILESVSKEGEWYLVKLEPDESGITSGYVHESLVLALEETPPPKAQQQVPPPVEEKPKIVEKIEKKEPEKTKPPEVLVQQPPRTEAAEAAPPAAGYSLALTAGGTYAAIGDLNKAAQGLADLYSEQLGVAADKQVTPIHLTYIFGGELVFPLSSQFFLSAGADYFLSKKESTISFGNETISGTFKTAPEITVLPVKLSITFYPASFLYFRIGASYYFAKCRYFYRFEHEDAWTEWQGDAKTKNVGFWGGLGLEWNLGGHLALLVEATSQFAPIKGFKGTGTRQDSTMAEPVTEEGTLYAYDGKISSVNSYPLLFIRDKLPTEGGVENAREAEIDFTGLTLRAGFRIKF